MPDPLKKTVSASQVAGLFNVSPYVTRWMLYQYFAAGVEIDSPENDRMAAGIRLQPAILKWAADELRLEVTENAQDDYLYHPALPIGCTPDGRAMDPAIGLGVVEAKNVDWLVWKREWTATAAPRHIEIQLQTQMLCMGATWGVIACLVGGNDLILYRRQPMPELWDKIGQAAVELFADIAAGNAPDPFGSAVELPILDQLYPASDPEIVADLRDDPEIVGLYELWESARAEATAAGKAVDQLKAQIVGRTKDAGKVLTAGGDLYVTRTQVPPSMAKLTPDQIEAIRAIDPAFVGIQTRAGFTKTTMKFRPAETADSVTVTPEYMEAYREFGEGIQRTKGA